jgi:hypothetical protein
MTRLYGVAEGDLAAYFLDPKRAEPIFKSKQVVRQAQAAQIAARAKEQGFGRMTELSGLYAEMAGEEELTEAEKIGAALGYDEAAIKKLGVRLATRKAQFAGGGGFARTTGATSGTVETGAGTAQ